MTMVSNISKPTNQSNAHSTYFIKYLYLLKGKGKGLDTCYSATYMNHGHRRTLQSRKWQLIGMGQWCRSALCDHPLSALTDNWTDP